MSRQRLKPSLGESAHNVCPRCKGTGVVRGVESLALSILRLLEEEATKDSTTNVQALLPVQVATFLLNEKRKIIHAIEKRQNVQIIIIPNPYMETPNYEIVRMRGNETLDKATYDVPVQPELEIVKSSEVQATAKIEQAAVSAESYIKEAAPVHVKKEVKKPGLFSRIWQALFGEKAKEKTNNKHHRGRKGNNRYDKSRQRNNRRNKNNRYNKDKRSPKDQKQKDQQTSNKQRDDRRKKPINKNDHRQNTRQKDQRNDEKRKAIAERPERQSREDRQSKQDELRRKNSERAESFQQRKAKASKAKNDANKVKSPQASEISQKTDTTTTQNQTALIEPKTVQENC